MVPVGCNGVGLCAGPLCVGPINDRGTAGAKDGRAPANCANYHHHRHYYGDHHNNHHCPGNNNNNHGRGNNIVRHVKHVRHDRHVKRDDDDDGRDNGHNDDGRRDNHSGASDVPIVFVCFLYDCLRRRVCGVHGQLCKLSHPVFESLSL